MVQTFDFMSKHYKHVLIQKVTFPTERALLTQPCTRKPCINTQKLMCTPMLYSHTNFLEYTETFSLTQCLSYLLLTEAHLDPWPILTLPILTLLFVSFLLFTVSLTQSGGKQQQPILTLLFTISLTLSGSKQQQLIMTFVPF